MRRCALVLGVVLSAAAVVGCGDDETTRDGDAGSDAATTDRMLDAAPSDAAQKPPADAAAANDAAHADDAGGGDDSGIADASVADASSTGATLDTTSIACFLGQTAISPALTGSGTCADPYVVDLSGLMLGKAVFTGTAAAASDETFGDGVCAWGGAGGTIDDIVYKLLLPSSGFTKLQIASDVGNTVDVKLSLLPASSCADAAGACIDDGVAGTCEAFELPVDASTFASPPLIVASRSQAGGFEIAFRLQ